MNCIYDVGRVGILESLLLEVPEGIGTILNGLPFHLSVRIDLHLAIKLNKRAMQAMVETVTEA